MTYSLSAMEDFTGQNQVVLRRLSFLEHHFLKGAQENKMWIIKACVRLGVDPNVTDQHKVTAFHYGVSHVNLEMLQYLVEHGAQVNAVSVGGCSALHITAILHDKPKLVRWLLDHGVSIDSQDDEGYTPLHRAVQFHRPKVARLLVDRGCNVGLTSNTGITPEMTNFECLFDICYAPFATALLAGNKEDIEKYCKQGVHLHFKTKCGTPMHWAMLSPKFAKELPMLFRYAVTQELRVLKKDSLEEVSADTALHQLINAQDLTGQTALHWVGQAGCLSQWQELLRFGAKLTVLDDEDTTPLYLVDEVLPGWQENDQLRTQFFEFLAAPQGTCKECKLLKHTENADRVFAFLCVLHRYAKELKISVPQDIRLMIIRRAMPEGIHALPLGSCIKRKTPLTQVIATTSFTTLARLVQQEVLNKEALLSELIKRHDTELFNVCALETNNGNTIFGLRLARALACDEYKELRRAQYLKLLEIVKESKQ